MSGMSAAGSATVLIVDDEAAIVDLLTLYLSRQRIPTSGAITAQAAIAAVKADPAIGVVVTDLRMPGLSGAGLAEELLRDREETAAVEVIVITGAGEGDPALEAVRTRVFEIVRKPFRPSEVAAAISRARVSVDRRRGGVGPRPPPDADAEPVAPQPEDLRELRETLLALVAAAEGLAGGPMPTEAAFRARTGEIRDGARQLLARVEAMMPRG